MTAVKIYTCIFVNKPGKQNRQIKITDSLNITQVLRMTLKNFNLNDLYILKRNKNATVLNQLFLPHGPHEDNFS